VGGFELRLGTINQITRGNTGASRALVKDFSSTLAINFGGDFAGGVRVDGPGMNIAGSLTVSGNQTVSGEILGRYDHANRFVVQSFVSQSINVPAGNNYVIAYFRIFIPSGKSLYLKRARFYVGGLPRIGIIGGGSWTGSSSNGDVLLDVNLVDGNNTERTLILIIYNSSTSTLSVTNGFGIWAELEIR